MLVQGGPSLGCQPFLNEVQSFVGTFPSGHALGLKLFYKIYVQKSFYTEISAYTVFSVYTQQSQSPFPFHFHCILNFAF